MSKGLEGIGLGLRHGMADATFAQAPAELRWLEVHPENYMWRGGRFETMLATARERFPLATHGLTMCFGSVQPFDHGYLRTLRDFLHDLRAPWHSDHLCFAGVDGMFAHDLLPLPHSRESIDVVVDRVRQAQDALGVPIALEHISYYAEAPGGQMGEMDHLLEILDRADARLLLDVNNVFVNSQNHDFDPRAWIDQVPMERVVQLHVAGHLIEADGTRIDTHGEAICEEVYDLLAYTLQRLGRPIGVLLERDGNFPDFAELVGEIQRLDGIYQQALSGAGECAAVEAHP